LYSFSSDVMDRLSIPPGLAWLLGACMEARGKQELWQQQKPEVLAALRELAIIQSAESSNRIEGVTVDADRLRPLLSGEDPPRDRPEEELFGYRRALDWIHSSYDEIDITPASIRQLHRLAQAGLVGDAGKWKTRNNEIVEILPSGERRIRFVPMSPHRTPKAMEQLCRGYHDVLEQGRLPPLIAESALVLDLLCIHPFRDGNGRVARLLALLTLRKQRFHVGAYISLERLIEQRKQEYYDSLAASSVGWHDARHDLLPWLGYMLSIAREAYDEMANRFEHVKVAGGKQALIRRIVSSQLTPFTLAQLSAQVPSVSRPTIKKVLAELRREGVVELEGRGRGARWTLRIPD